MKKGKIFFLFLLFFCISWIDNLYAKSINFSGTNETFSNPERWFRDARYMLTDNNYSETASGPRKLVQSMLYLTNFQNSEVDKWTLNSIEEAFSWIRANGLKTIFRVSYWNQVWGSLPWMDIIELHMKQLQPILEKNKDVIAFYQNGYMWLWGERHWWGAWNQPFEDSPENWKRLQNLELEYAPKWIFLQQRYPPKKLEIFNNQRITSENAFSNEAVARVGHINDCFLSWNQDSGTYVPEYTQYSDSPDHLRSYTWEDTKWSPMWGETCGSYDPWATMEEASCEWTISQMEKFHRTYLSFHSVEEQIASRWREEWCYDEIDRRLWYRLELKTLDIPNTLSVWNSNTLKFTIENKGFARSWYQRKWYIHFIQNWEVKHTVELSNIDLRSIDWWETKTLTTTLNIPSNISWDYQLALWLPDRFESNHGDKRYSMRLANEWMWNDSRWDNIILDSISVEAGSISQVEEEEEVTTEEETISSEEESWLEEILNSSETEEETETESWLEEILNPSETEEETESEIASFNESIEGIENILEANPESTTIDLSFIPLHNPEHYIYTSPAPKFSSWETINDRLIENYRYSKWEILIDAKYSGYIKKIRDFINSKTKIDLEPLYDKVFVLEWTKVQRFIKDSILYKLYVKD